MERQDTAFRRIASALCASLVLLVLCACSQNTQLRDIEADRYNELEGTLLTAQQEEEQRRRAELRVAERLRKLDAERAAANAARQSAYAATTSPAQGSLQEAGENRSRQGIEPMVTHIVVAAPGTEPQSDGSHELWRTRIVEEPADGQARCMLTSHTVTIPGEDGTSRVHLQFSRDRLMLVTDGLLDPQAEDRGIRIDFGIPVAFDRFIDEQTALIERDLEPLIQSMLDGNTLSVAFGLRSAQESASRTQIMEISLEDLAAALVQLDACNNRT